MKYTQKDADTRKLIQVIGPDGEILTPANLPPANLTRWVARRKAEVVAAVHGGLLTLEDACGRYAISAEEFLEWERRYETKGLAGLRAQVRHDREPPVLH